MDKAVLVDYRNRVNRVFEYIDENLDADLSLETISSIASFSPYHFHRVFKFITQETLNEYVTRKRVEKAASFLLHKDLSITEISVRCGFNDGSSFTRAFKKYYQTSPSEFKNQHPNKFSKIRQLKRKNGQEYPSHDQYISIITNLKNWITMNAKIEIKTVSKMNLAHIPVMGPQNLENAFDTLIQWATPNGLMNQDTKMVTIYYDSFKVTEAQKVRMSAGMVLETEIETGDEIRLTSIEAGRCIVGHFEIGIHEFEKSWTGLFLWMNQNGYKKTDKTPFEIYHNDFRKHPQQKVKVDLYIPIQ